MHGSCRHSPAPPRRHWTSLTVAAQLVRSGGGVAAHRGPTRSWLGGAALRAFGYCQLPQAAGAWGAGGSGLLLVAAGCCGCGGCGWPDNDRTRRREGWRCNSAAAAAAAAAGAAGTPSSAAARITLLAHAGSAATQDQTPVPRKVLVWPICAGQHQSTRRRVMTGAKMPAVAQLGAGRTHRHTDAASRTLKRP